MRRIERAATASRDGDVSPAAAPSLPGSAPAPVQLFEDPAAERTAIFGIVADAKRQNTRAAIAASLLSSQPPGQLAPLQPPPPPPLQPNQREARFKGYTCADHRDAFELLFPGACQYYSITGACKQDTCKKKHEQQSRAAVDAHVLAVGGKVIASVKVPTLRDG
jgi:hypothetical protein